MALAAAAAARSLLSSAARSSLPLLLSKRFSSSPSPSLTFAGLLRPRSSPSAALLLPTAIRLMAARIGQVRFMSRRPGGDSYSPLNKGGNDRPPMEMAPLFPGCDYNHWLIVMDDPGGKDATKEQMIDCYIKTLTQVVGSEEEAKKKIYNVACKQFSGLSYFGFGCEIDEETSNRLEGLPGVLFVLPDSYVDAENKDYGAELFVNGEIVRRSPERERRVQPVPQNARDRPRYNDRTRYARRRENQR